MYRKRLFPKKKNVTLSQPKSNEFVITDEYKNTICSQSYLGKKGYTIPKSILSKQDEEFLRKDLFVKPVSFGTNFGPGETTTFPVFRENANKFYLPRFYGIQRYGLPSRSEVGDGENIDVTFSKPLRDYQEKIIDVYMKYVNTPVCNENEKKGNGGILEVPCGRGKCLGKDTPILMYDGTIKMVQDIIVGDKIMGDDSTPRNVLTLARGKEMMYKVSSQKCNGYIVNESHILSLKTSIKLNKKTPKNSIIDMCVTDYLNLPKYYHGRSGPLLGYRVPIEFKEAKIDVDPYLLGYWLGNETIISTQESTDNKNIFLDFLCNNNLIENKHIPHNYKCNSRKIQLELLAGLIDSDGHYYNNCYKIIQKNEKLLDDIIFLARSLGLSAFKTKKQKICKNSKNGSVNGGYYETNIYGVGLEEIPVKCLHKKGHMRQLTRDCLKYRICLEKLQVDDYYGFEIDGNHRFVLGDFTVTHNTVIALKIISLLKKKTLIIVHKEFLMNQWIDRINEFLPGARVGKIQGSIFNVDGNDIVIGMIQSLYDKDYPVETFSCFGLTIIDEVHRIGSEQFSRTLFKTITPCMLGISATVDRKDKLTKVLYMFIGEKIYTEKREDDDLVSVRAIRYQTNDPDFNEVEVDFRGTAKYSTMITKLCDFGPRSDFIIRVIKDLVEEEPDNQIMILCHNRSLLSYLYDGINYKNIAPVGYYVGGMKQNKLQETETKQIVLATYAMAAEALDIKSLSTLVMVTPKTDITQSVGRILRVKHDNPIIVDIVDSHNLFENQWIQRKRFYKKCNYRIREIDSKKYTEMAINWENDTLWKRTFDPKNKTNIILDCKKEESDDELDTKHRLGSDQVKCLINLSGLEDL
jgi:superfamily II DNA or RNA helicase